MPGVGGQFHRHSNGSQSSLPAGVTVPHNSTVTLSQPNSFYSQSQNGGFGLYTQNANDGQMPPPMQDTSALNAFNNQQTPISPPYTQHSATNNTPPVSASLPQVSQGHTQQMQGFGNALFDPSDPALFNFDIASLNFGSHYGALEFGMLGHISGAAADTPPNDNSLMMNQGAGVFQPPGSASSQMTDGTNHVTALSYGTDALPDWQNNAHRQNSVGQMHTPQSTPLQANLEGAVRHDSFPGPYAYAIGAGPASISSASPASTSHDAHANYDQSSVSPAFFTNSSQPKSSMYGRSGQPRANTNFPLQPVNPNVGSRKRRRDTRAIYEDLKQPYPYTQAFHRLQMLLQERLPAKKRVKVAQALAAIRPTFIACMKDLDDADLIHQERTFQRKLWSYQDWLEYMGTPTLIVRRSGEVAAVGKEFCILSSWRKDVLLGKEPNLNVNWDCSPGQISGASSVRASSTPRLTTIEEQPRAQPVFLAELLDSDSIVQFYDDFKRLAFGDARGAVERRCRIMKYRTKLDDESAPEPGNGHQDDSGTRKENKRKYRTDSDASLTSSMQPRPTNDSVECMVGWTCWHDQFDMPAMIVMNVSFILDQD